MKFFVISFLVMCVSLSVMAQTTLQKNQSQKGNSVTTNKYILDPNKPIQNNRANKVNPNTRSNESPDQKVTRVYASHVLTALCAQDFMEKYRDVNWSQAQKSAFWKRYQNGCRCLSGEILSVVPAGEVVDFARYTYADTEQATPENLDMKRLDAISVLYSSPQLLKKCGLPK